MPALTSAPFDLAPATGPAFDLAGALLTGTKFPQRGNLVYGNNRVNLTGALVDADTVFPFDFDPLAAGAKFVTKAELGGSSSPEAPVAFISYAWADEDVVLAIDQWMRLNRISTKIDRRDFFAGARIRDEIIRVMQECSAVIVMYSAIAKDKPWPQFERELAADMEMEAKAQGKHPPDHLRSCGRHTTSVGDGKGEDRCAGEGKAIRTSLRGDLPRNSAAAERSSHNRP